MSNYWLCDGCALRHRDVSAMVVECERYGAAVTTTKKVMFDGGPGVGYRDEHEVCPHYKSVRSHD